MLATERSDIFATLSGSQIHSPYKWLVEVGSNTSVAASNPAPKLSSFFSFARWVNWKSSLYFSHLLSHGEASKVGWDIHSLEPGPTLVDMVTTGFVVTISARVGPGSRLGHPSPKTSKSTKAMCFFFYVSRHFFFHQTYAGARKKNKMPKEKKILAQCPRLPDRQMTYQTYCVERSHSFVYFLPHNDKVKQLPVTTKVGLFLVLHLSSQAKNVLESSTETFINIANAFVLPRPLVRWEAWPRFRFQTKHVSCCFCQSKTPLLSAESTFDDFNGKDLGFWFSVTRQCNSLASASQEGVEVFSKLWEMCMNGEHHAFRIMVWDVDPIIYLHPVLRAWHRRSTALILWSSVFFFFFWFSAKSYAGGWRLKHRKKSTWPNLELSASMKTQLLLLSEDSTKSRTKIFDNKFGKNTMSTQGPNSVKTFGYFQRCLIVSLLQKTPGPQDCSTSVIVS